MGLLNPQQIPPLKISSSLRNSVPMRELISQSSGLRGLMAHGANDHSRSQYCEIKKAAQREINPCILRIAEVILHNTTSFLECCAMRNQYCRFAKPARSVRSAKSVLAGRALQNQVIILTQGSYPLGHYVRKLGDIGDLETELSAILVEHDITITPFSETVSFFFFFLLFKRYPVASEKIMVTFDSDQFRTPIWPRFMGFYAEIGVNRAIQ